MARAVLPVGPLSIRKGDPFGLVRHENSSSTRSRYSLPPTVMLNTLNAGIQRDEGQPSGEIVDDDLDFYGLRNTGRATSHDMHWLVRTKPAR